MNSELSPKNKISLKNTWTSSSSILKSPSNIRRNEAKKLKSDRNTTTMMPGPPQGY